MSYRLPLKACRRGCPQAPEVDPIHSQMNSCSLDMTQQALFCRQVILFP